MSFHLNEKSFKSSFDSAFQPKLLSVCLVQGNFSKVPRVMHQHDDRIEVLLVCSGECDYNIDGVSYQAKAGDLIIYNQDIIHDEGISLDTEMLVYSLAASQIKLSDRPLNQISPASVPAVIPSGERFGQLRSLFEMIYAMTMPQQVRQAEIASYLLRAILVMIEDLVSHPEPNLITDEKALGQTIKNYLDEHFLEDISLSTAAAALHLNQFYLSHLFKAYSGFAPMHYVIRRRIGEAQTLLLNTQLGVTKIATQVGYNNINHFHSIFFKIVGMSPGKYRKSWTNQQ